MRNAQDLSTAAAEVEEAFPHQTAELLKEDVPQFR
jgi:hypothetical protein